MKRELLILGGGESGVGAAILGRTIGLDVFLSERGELRQPHRDSLLQHGIPFEEHGHAQALHSRAGEVIKSPGIPDEAPIVQQLLERGLSVVSELEFAARHTAATLIAVTGTNGKTTTASLIHHILERAGLDVGLAGNIGHSFARMVALEPHEVYVLEVSSFQLEHIHAFKPHIAVITNITPDHLDRYAGSFERYAAAKFKILKNQDSRCFFLYDADDQTIATNLKERELPAVCYPFSVDQILEKGAWLAADTINFKTDQAHFSMKKDHLSLMGMHNVRNSMASGLAASLMRIRKETIRQSLADFTAMPHRLERVASVHQMNFINDSKATNVNATFYALQSMQHPVVWIAGGVDKGNDYGDLLPLVREKVRAIIALGIDNSAITDCFERSVPVLVQATSMRQAVQLACELGSEGDDVLLSPACASFDRFEDYRDRGEQFSREVKKL